MTHTAHRIETYKTLFSESKFLTKVFKVYSNNIHERKKKNFRTLNERNISWAKRLIKSFSQSIQNDIVNKLKQIYN